MLCIPGFHLPGPRATGPEPFWAGSLNTFLCWPSGVCSLETSFLPQTSLFHFLLEPGPQPARGSFCFAGGSWWPRADTEALLGLPVNPHPVLAAPRLAPAQCSRDYPSSPSAQASGRADTLTPISHQMSSQRLGRPGTPCAPVRPHRPGPCRNLEGMCLLGPCPVLTEARTRASPCPSLPDTQGFIVRLCHGNYAHGLPVHMASAEKITGPSRSAKTRGPEPPKQASYVTPGPLDTSGGLVWGCPPVTPPPPAPAICLSLLRDLESSARLDRHVLPYMAVSF